MEQLEFDKIKNLAPEKAVILRIQTLALIQDTDCGARLVQVPIRLRFHCNQIGVARMFTGPVNGLNGLAIVFQRIMRLRQINPPESLPASTPLP